MGLKVNIYCFLNNHAPSIAKLSLFWYSNFQSIFSKDPKVITKKQSQYFGDGFATVHHVSFLDDPEFMTAYADSFFHVPKNVANHDNLDIIWRTHICTWIAKQVNSLDGDFVECGVWYGLLSKAMCDYIDIDKTNHKFYLFDTWGETPNGDAHPNYKTDMFDVVKERFSKFKNVHLFRGLVPAILNQVDIKKIVYLGIDMNGSFAERATLEKYYDKIVPGGIIYFDDYGWDYPDLRKTVDDFFKDKPETLLHFPSGNSIVIKI